MTTYSCQASDIRSATDLQKKVGALYHLGLSGPLGANGATVYYGYLLNPDNSQSGGFHQRSDTASKDALINYSSGNLIDRDLAFFPRVTDGDFSGGGYQEVWLQTNRYFDSDLDPRIPGFLQLRAQWLRQIKVGLTVGSHAQVVPFNNDFWFTFGEANGNVYSAVLGSSSSPTAASVLSLDTDGTYLYAGTATSLWRSSDGAIWNVVTTTLINPAQQWWVINQGTNGYFAYYAAGGNLLYKIDLTLGFPVAAGSQAQVLFGGNALNIVDLVEYQTSLAIVSNDIRGPGFDIWYYDGANMTRIIRIEGYAAQGMCTALGSLYVGASAVGQQTSPILARIDSGSYTVVARPGSPFPTPSQSCLQPRASSQYVYWPITNQSIKGISAAKGVVLQYDALTQAVSHLPNMDATDYTTPLGVLRTVAALGDTIACCYANGTAGVLEYQQPALGGTPLYQASGWLVSSHIDFSTPGIAKRFRRIEVHHSPLNAGESIKINAYVDQDPLQFTTSLTPVPSTATATNSTVASTITTMTFGQDTIGKTLYFALQINETEATPSTSPRVSYVSIEVGGTWAWELLLACTSKRALLDGQNEETLPTGKDLAYLLLLAYEQGQNLVFYHRNGQSYTVTIESLDLWNPSPKQPQAAQEIRDEEYLVKATLRQVA